MFVYTCVFVNIHVKPRFKRCSRKHFICDKIESHEVKYFLLAITKYIYFFQVSRAVWEEMVNACWCGLLAALSLLLDARYLVFNFS